MMLTPTERRSLRRAYLRGFALGRRPPTDRWKLEEQARRLMDQLPVFHRHAIVCQSAIEAGPEEMVRAAASMLSTAVAITKRMPVIQRALFVEQIFKEARKLLGSYTDNEQMETRH